jgi:hypothetical protein
MRQFGNIILSRCCKGWGDWGWGMVVGFVYLEGFKKNTEYILFLRSMYLGGEGCWQRMAVDSIYNEYYTTLFIKQRCLIPFLPI